jgi:hypothetical protein
MISSPIFFLKKGRHLSHYFILLFSLHYFCLFGLSHSIFYAKQHQTELVKTFVIQIPYRKMQEASSLPSYKSGGPLPFILLEPSIPCPPSLTWL